MSDGLGGGRPMAHPDDPTSWDHETARVNGVSLHYVTVAPNSDAVDNPTGVAPLVVLLHGFPEFWYSWRHQLDAIAAAGYRVVAPDMRGYNRSSAPAGVDSYRPAELVADVRGLIEHRGAPQATVVGHDWGGLVGWELAIRDPDVVRQLVVLNSPHPDLFRQRLLRSPEQLLRSWYVFATQLPWLPERLLAADDFGLLTSAFEETTVPDAFTDADIERYREAMARSESLSGPLHYYRAMARETLTRELRALVGGSRRDGTVEVPTLVLWGEQDPALGVELLDGLDEWVPSLTVRRYPEASHWVQAERPADVTEQLLAFADG